MGHTGMSTGIHAIGRCPQELNMLLSVVHEVLYLESSNVLERDSRVAHTIGPAYLRGIFVGNAMPPPEVIPSCSFMPMFTHPDSQMGVAYVVAEVAATDPARDYYLWHWGPLYFFRTANTVDAPSVFNVFENMYLFYIPTTGFTSCGSAELLSEHPHKGIRRVCVGYPELAHVLTPCVQCDVREFFRQEVLAWTMEGQLPVRDAWHDLVIPKTFTMLARVHNRLRSFRTNLTESSPEETVRGLIL